MQRGINGRPREPGVSTSRWYRIWGRVNERFPNIMGGTNTGGRSHGRIDGSQQQSNNPSRHWSHLFEDIDEGNERAECYLEGYNIGYDNAYADASEPSYDDAPNYGTNERDYYDDGCRDGTGDAQMGMSMVYERHSDMYDSRFEPYFKQGYEACWRQYR